MEISASVFRFGGFVLAHAALIASNQDKGELICPFAVVAKDDNRQLIDFEAATQEEAVAKGKASLDEYREHVDFWSFAREGLYSVIDQPGPKTDVLLVSAWAPGMIDTIEIMQQFVPSYPGPFVLLGEPDIFIDGKVQREEAATSVRSLVSEGIKQHPKGNRWATWRGD